MTSRNVAGSRDRCYMTGVQAPSRAADGLGPGFRFVAIGVVSERLPLDRVTAANQ